MIAEVNDYEVKLVKVAGEFVWHTHDDTDELFLVLSGELTIQMRDHDVVLGPGELFVVPRSVQHCPRAEVETAALLLEPKGVVNTGDAGGDLTAATSGLHDLERRRPDRRSPRADAREAPRRLWSRTADGQESYVRLTL